MVKEIPDEIPEFIIVCDVLDLHGTDPVIIPDMIRDFLKNALELGYSRVRIIHGKGKSKLKFLTYQVLIKESCVDNFYDAPPENGGWGATIVELKGG
ncbi:Smr/MutS family protein [candidate division KSB1 bacterium]|nr:Smr/MutS family protein [candidate division KSB1 bacterium]